MQMVLGITEGAWVEICVVLLPIILGVFFTLKAKSDKLDIMVDVKKEIDDNIKPIEKRMDKHDLDFKEFKRDEILPMKETINQLVTKQTVIDVKVDTIIDGIGELRDYIIKMSEKLDKKQDKK
jgi:hypothetical protein